MHVYYPDKKPTTTITNKTDKVLLTLLRTAEEISISTVLSAVAGLKIRLPVRPGGLCRHRLDGALSVSY